MKPPPPPPPLRPLPPPPVSYGNGGGGVTYSRSYPAPRPRLSPSGQVNDQGNALFAARDYEGAIEKYRQALRINPGNQVARTNLAGARARLAAKHKDYARALSYQREACRLKPNKFYCVPILSYQAHLAREEGDYARALAKYRQAYREAPTAGRLRNLEKMQQLIAEQQQRPTASTARQCPFGRCGNPEDTAINATAPRNPSAAGRGAEPGGAGRQITGIERDARRLPARTSDEAARHRMGCGFDGTGDCSLGPALPRITPGQISLKSAVFPGLSEQSWSKLQKSEAGAALIKQADELLTKQKQLKGAIHEVRSSADAAQRLEELIALDKSLDKVNEKLNGFQKEAEKIVVVLE